MCVQILVLVKTLIFKGWVTRITQKVCLNNHEKSILQSYITDVAIFQTAVYQKWPKN